MSISSEREARERLGMSLVRLSALNAADLARNNQRKSPFHGGLPYFERTLKLFRAAGKADLRALSPERLRSLADDAESTLAWLREIMNFTSEGVEGSQAKCAAMIAAVRDAYEPMRERLAPFINSPADAAPVAALKRRRIRRLAVTVGVTVATLAGAIVVSRLTGHEYSDYIVLADKVMGALR